MDSIELKRIILGCNNVEDSNYIRENVRKVIDGNNPYDICDFVENVKSAHTTEFITMFEDRIIQIGDIVHTYEFMFLLADMGVKSFNLKRFEEIIRSSNNPKLMLYSLGFVEGIDQESMLHSLYMTKNAKYIEQLSTNEDYASINVNERPEYAEQLKIAKEYRYFQKSLEECECKSETDEKVNIKALIHQVIELEDGTQEQIRKKAYLINELANYIEYVPNLSEESRNKLRMDLSQSSNIKYRVVDSVEDNPRI